MARGVDAMTSNNTAPEGDGAAASVDFASLYDSLAGRLLGAARTLGCTGTEAEDIVHDLFVRLVRSGACLGDVDDPEAYAFTSLRHAVSRSRQRKALERASIERIGREREADGRMVAEGTAGVADEPDVRLVRALAGLPEAQREVVALKIDGGLTFAQIAKVTNVSLNTAAGRYRYALDKLRAALAVEVIR
jgi:RNA polymerase sigma-70 factor (ECF subfamily)